ncbi:MAG: NAD(P)/FAD-dependent oxidoreductase [Nitrososphaeraceae archaeon]
MNKKIGILGAGYGGIFTAANLLNKENGIDFDIKLFDKNSYHQLLQQIHLVTANIKKFDDVGLDIKSLLKNEIDFVNKSIKEIDIDKKIVYTIDNKKYTFDYIIIALGASNAYFNIPGAEKYTTSFRSLEDAIKLKEKIMNGKEEIIIAICGGGPTGISLGGALSETFKKKIKIKIIEAKNDILPGWDKKLIHDIRELLNDKNVEIITKDPIKEIVESYLVLKNSKNKIYYDIAVWTAGIKGRDIKINPQIKKTKSNRIIINRYSQIHGYQDVFAIGDISSMTLKNGDSAPQLAQFAVRQARNVAKNIRRKEKQVEMIEFDYSPHGNILSLGKECMGLLNGVIVKGTLCEYVEDFLIDNYISSIKNKGRGLASLAYEQDLLSEVSTSIFFMIKTASKLFS